MFAVVSSTLLLGSITAMATTIAATSFTENVSVLVQAPAESWLGVPADWTAAEQIIVFKPENVRADHLVCRE